VTELPQVEAYAARRIAWWTLFCGVLLIGLPLSQMVSSLLSRQLLRPIQRLQTGVQRIGQGDFNALKFTEAFPAFQPAEAKSRKLDGQPVV
jgi:nitrate/nitrite-specific signal transduction histidine kinase